jgi:hypothetical protein
MKLVACDSCGAMRVEGSRTCPHCDGSPATVHRAAAVAALMLGLVGSGCGGQGQAIYGAALIDADGDGYFDGDDDCDDGDPDVNPDAEETPGDGIDSNCDGEDDT